MVAKSTTLGKSCAKMPPAESPKGKEWFVATSQTSLVGQKEAQVTPQPASSNNLKRAHSKLKKKNVKVTSIYLRCRAKSAVPSQIL